MKIRKPTKSIRVPLVMAEQLENEAYEHGVYLTDYLRFKKIEVKAE